ncbi:MAG: phosphatidylserine decarboxylase [Thiobacillaceae bacterium]|nr:phosphatidylserine decarboxylase [Thiobacillaceae bacterium]MCX7673198.1 phosphatidylserine decarboxylase [Thiobacillaceae bacterium]MDW8322861.1 phosphatidylserine decarboxylase [Burkholderiales bacterium]
MRAEAQPLIAREGWAHVGLSLLAAVAVTLGLDNPWVSLPFWLAAAFVLQFFRDPPRTPVTGPGLVLSPADGRVVAVETTDDPWLERRALKISVFMHVFNVHSNRSPVDGVVRQQWYHHGAFLNAVLDKASRENERNALWLTTDDGQDVTCVQVAGLVARRILSYVQPGQRLARGERYGFIRFGSRLDVYLPLAARPRVGLGDKVRAAESVLAELPR